MSYTAQSKWETVNKERTEDPCKMLFPYLPGRTEKYYAKSVMISDEQDEI
jgi:hypothetical protein